MNIQAEKLDLIHWLSELTDKSMIARIKALRAEKTASLTAAHKAILEERLSKHKLNPDSGSSWQEVKERIAK